MDPMFTPILLLGFLVAIGLTGLELRAANEAPACPQCGHCQLVAEARRQREAELRESYAQRWGLGEREDDDRHTR